MRFIGISLSLCGVLLLTGCGKDSWSGSKGARGGLAVVDLNAVATRLGRAEEINDAVKLKDSSLAQQWNEAQKKYLSRLESKQKSFSEPATDEEKAEYQQLLVNCNTDLARKRQEAQTDLQNYRQELLNRFRDDVKPVAQGIAVEKGLSTVISKSEMFVLSVEQDADITNSVIDKMRANMPPKAVVAAPTEKPKQVADAPAKTKKQ